MLLKVIAAEGEHKASSALAQASHVIEESPHALQVSSILSHTLLVLSNILSASLPADTEFHFGRTQFNHHLPNAHQHSKHLESRGISEMFYFPGDFGFAGIFPHIIRTNIEAP